MLQAAARKAAAVQRSSFFSLLRVKDVLVPQATAAEPLSDDAVARVKEDISQSADALIEAHKPLLPPACERAPAHLQMAALALAAQRHLLHVSATTDELNLVDAAEVRWVVGGAIGVVAPPNGEEPWAVPVNYVPNRLSMVITGSVWQPHTSTFSSSRCAYAAALTARPRPLSARTIPPCPTTSLCLCTALFCSRPRPTHECVCRSATPPTSA